MEIRRRPYGGTIPTLVGRITNPAVLSFTDTSITKGVLYEYMVSQLYANSLGQVYVFNSQTWVASGVEVPLEDARGTALLLVDETMAPALSRRIDVFRRNLIGSGWKVLVETVARDTNPIGTTGTTALTSDPRPTKQVITNTLASHPDLKAVVLIGRVTIPFAGNEMPDFHGTRAHATDAYYADINESWTDSINHGSSLTPRNIPNDLRWDRGELENGRELMVGRIDFAGMNAFSESEVQLLDRYLNKNHAFRHGFLVANRRAIWTANQPLIDSNISNMISYFGNSNVTGHGSNFWSAVTANQSFLWGAAGATGSSSNTGGISTTDMAASDYKVVFATAGASYMMETWRNNSAIRAFIAMPTWGIASMVSNGYFGETTFPRFSMGRLIGELNLGPTTRYPESLPQRSGLYGYAQKSIFSNLHGDPTVAMYATLPPSNLRVTTGSGALLQWDASLSPNLVGHHVY